MRDSTTARHYYTVYVAGMLTKSTCCSHLGHLSTIYLVLNTLWHCGNLQQSLAKLLSLCGTFYLTPFSFKHLEGLVRKARLGSWKPLTWTHRMFCIRELILNTRLRIRARFWQVKKVCLRDTWPSGPHIPAQWLPEGSHSEDPAGIGHPADARPAGFPSDLTVQRSADSNTLFQVLILF